MKMPSQQLQIEQLSTSKCKTNIDSVVSVAVIPNNITITENSMISTNADIEHKKNLDKKQFGDLDESIVNYNVITISSISENDYNTHKEKSSSKITDILESNVKHKTLNTIFNIKSDKSNNITIKDNSNITILPVENDKTTTTTNITKSSSKLNISYCISFQNNITNVDYRKGRRLNGLQLPLHPLQLFGWAVLCLFGIATYCLLIPSFSEKYQIPLYSLVTGLYIVHIISHLAALLIDPADPELRRLHHNDRVVPEFDRSKHAHVIENGRCHLCNICTTSTSTKHCSVCNKCVGKFDHHCKWLNHCIGSRNYVAFLMCVVSAVCATFIILGAVLFQFAIYFIKPEWLNLWYDSNSILLATSNNNQSLENVNNIEFYLNNDTNFSKYFESNTSELRYFENRSVEDALLYINSGHFIKENTSLLNKMVNHTLEINSEAKLTVSSDLENISYTENALVGDNFIVNNTSNIVLSGITVSHKIFLILIGCLGFLAAITAGLLLHLCFFHIYISFLGLTTYEYIRNHRQAEEASKSKNQVKRIQENGNASIVEFSENHHPSNLANSNSAEIYFCSKVHYPNSTCNDNDLSLNKTPKTQLKIHCCANSREYNHTAFRTYYMCSSSEETVIKLPLPKSYTSNDISKKSTHNMTISQEEEEEEEESSNERIKMYHCCSSFKSTKDTESRANTAICKANLYGRKCKRKLSSMSRHNGEVQDNHATCSTSNNSQASSINNQRCCMKSISKQQRWRRKWNCCTVVPDSPDVPHDLIASLTAKHQQELKAKKNTVTEIPVHFITSTRLNGTAMENNGHLNSPTLTINPMKKILKSQSRQRCNFPGARFRHIMQILKPYKKPPCRVQNFSKFPLTDHFKQNQIRPFPSRLNIVQNGCQNHHLNVCNSDFYCDNSSPQPPSTTTTMSESSTDSSNLTTPNSQTCSTFKTSVLPTSIIRDDISITYVPPPTGLILPPALPPPVRRKIPNPTDLDKLAETLDCSLHLSNNNTLPANQRLPAINNLYRQQRRKLLRTRSPTLSPIHESGLSNPTSPQPCRHAINSCTLTTCN